MLLSIHAWFDRSCRLITIGLLSASLGIAVPGHAQLSQATQATQAPAVSKQLLPWLSQVPSPPEQPSQSPDWRSFTSAAGHYAVDFPAWPTQFTSTTQVPEGTLTWQVTETRMPGINTGETGQAGETGETGETGQTGRPSSYEYYMIAYTTLSADHLNSRKPDDLVQAISDAVLLEGGLNQNVQLQEPILFHNYPARLVIGTANDQYWVMIVSLVDGRLYTNLAFSEQRDRVMHFFDSFTFTNSPS